jgi:hypothetical protein
MDLPVLADSRMDALVNAPCETIDLTEWVTERECGGRVCDSFRKMCAPAFSGHTPRELNHLAIE